MEEEKNKPEDDSQIDNEQAGMSSEPSALSSTPSANNTTKSEPENQKTEITMEPHVHSHTHHDKKWKDYLLEFLMIFLAVTLSFFAESYREHSVEKSRAREYARSLIHDLEKDTAMVQRDIRQINFIITRIDSLVDFLKGKKINEISNGQLFAYTRIGGYRPYTWSRATLEEIKGSGSLRYFSNDSIIMRISAYDAHTKHMDEDFKGDDERSDKIADEKKRIIDMNYSLGDPLTFYLVNPDSLITMISEKELSGQQPDLKLLTNNINDIKSLLNGYLAIKDNLNGRGSIELAQLTAEAAELIHLLKKEYHLQ